MKRINILFLLLLLPLFSIGQQTLSLEECYALSIKLPIARQTDLLQQNQFWKLKRLIKLPKIDYQSDVSLPITLPNVTVNPPNKDQYYSRRQSTNLTGGLIDATKIKKQTKCPTNRSQPIPTQIQNQSVVLLDLSATRATCYFNDETRTIRV
jgi:hypothetical protein